MVIRAASILTILLPLVLVSLTVSCGSTKNEAMDTVTYWVNSQRVPCTGVGPMECLEVRKEGSDTWELFYSQIEGFQYEPGYLFRIRVQLEKLDPSLVPADASSIKYTLISVEEKVRDPKLRINDIWMLREIEGREVPEGALAGGLQRPYIEFHLQDSRYMGTDGCNTFRGSIVSVGDRKIQMGPAMSTRMSCGDMTIPNTFMKLLSRVDAYGTSENTLILLEGNTELFKFAKTD